MSRGLTHIRKVGAGAGLLTWYWYKQRGGGLATLVGWGSWLLGMGGRGELNNYFVIKLLLN